MAPFFARTLALAMLFVAPAAIAKPPATPVAKSASAAAAKASAKDAKASRSTAAKSPSKNAPKPAGKAPARSSEKRSAKPSKKRAPGKTAKLEPRARRASPGKSVGSPTAGRLIGGARLEEGPHLRIVPFYAPGGAHWGLESLVTLIDQAARTVRKKFPGAALSVGHLSRKGGGDIDRHASHESGRDVDVAFYVLNHRGKPIYADHFVSFKGDGTAPTWPGARFDDARNWAFVAAVVGSPRARVSHIFVSEPIRARLLAHARKIGAPASIRKRAAQLMMQPRGGDPHDDHFHIRISCPPGSQSGKDRCIENPAPRKRTPDKAVARARGAASKPSDKRSTPARAEPRRAPSPATRASNPRPARPPPKDDPAKDDPASNEPAPPPAASPSRAEASAGEEEEAPVKWPAPERVRPSKREAFIPSLAPIVPGLDSVVIAAPRAGAKDKAPPKPPPKTTPKP